MSLLRNRSTPTNGAVAAPQAPAAVAAPPMQPPPPPQMAQPPIPQVFMAPPQIAQPPHNIAPAQTMPPPVPAAAPPPPPPPQAAPPPPPAAVAAPPAPAPAQQAPVGKWILAREAQQGFQYVLPPSNVLAMYLVSTNGKQSFLPIENGRPGGAPILKEYNDQVYELANSRVADAPLAVVGSGQSQPAAAQPPPAATEAPAPAKRGRKKLQVDASTAPAPASTPAEAPTGEQIILCVNVVPNGPFIDLNNYVAEILGEMEQQFQVPDVRAVMDDKNALAFARWRGVLAGLAKQNPPPPGTYVAFTKGSETVEVVAEALATLCTAPGQLWRGV